MSDFVLIMQAREGRTLSMSTVPQPMLRPVQAEAAAVQLYARYADEPVGTEWYLGSVRPGGTLTVEHNPDFDRDLVISQNPVSVDGVPAFGQPLDFDSIALPVNRITEEPLLNQASDATFTNAKAGVKVGVYTRVLRVQVSESDEFPNDATTTTTDYPVVDGNLPDLVDITRVPDGSGTLRLYVRAAAGGGGGRFGPWTTIPLAVDFADSVGAGGSPGSGGFPPGSVIIVEHNET